MSKEIERKFLVRKDLWYAVMKPAGLSIRQGYLVAEKEKTIRIRITDSTAFLTIKGPTCNATRDEYEFVIPVDPAAEILDKLATNKIEKIRYTLQYKGKKWEVDEFLGDNDGLILAEIELTGEKEIFARPPLLGEEVTNDERYYNPRLAENPFKSWN